MSTLWAFSSSSGRGVCVVTVWEGLLASSEGPPEAADPTLRAGSPHMPGAPRETGSPGHQGRELLGEIESPELLLEKLEQISSLYSILYGPQLL